MNYKLIIIVVLLIGTLSIYAQEEMNIAVQIEKAYDDKNYDKVIELAETLVLEGKIYLATKYAEKVFNKDPKNERAYKIVLYYYSNSDKTDDYIDILETRVDEVQDADALFRLGILYKQKNDPDEAYEYFQKAKKINPSPEVERELKLLSAEKFITKGEKFLKDGNYWGAIENLSKAVETFNDNYELHVKYANALYLVKKYDDAVKILTKAVKLKPNKYEAYKLLSLVYIAEDDFINTIKYLKKTIKYKPTHYWGYLKCGISYYKNDSYSLAKKYLSKAKRLNKKDPESYYYLGLVELKNKNYKKAQEHLQMAKHYGIKKDLDKSINELKVYNYIDEANKTKNTDKAIKLYKKAIEIREDSELYTGLGNLYQIKKDMDESEKYYRKALALDPRKINAIKGLSSCLRKKGETGEAKRLLSDLSDKTKNDPEMCYRFGLIYEEEVNFVKAISYYKKALTLNADYTKANIRIGYCYYRKAVNNYRNNKINIARDDITRALKISPDNADYQDALNKINFASTIKKIKEMNIQAEIMIKKKEYDEAIRIYDEIIEMNPELKEIYFSLAKCYFLKKDYESTLRVYEKIKIEFPKDIKVHYNFGRVYCTKDDFDQAEYWFKYYVSNGGDKIKAYAGLADVYLYKKDYEKAKEYYKKILNINPKSMSALIGFGNVCFYQKSYDAALKYYIYVMKIEPENIEAHYNSGIIYLKRGEYERAGRYFLKTEQKVKNNGAIYYSLGRLYFYKNDMDMALKYLNKAMTLRENILDKWALGNVYVKLSKKSSGARKREYQKKAYDLFIECMNNKKNPAIRAKAKKALVFNSPTGNYMHTSKFKPLTKVDALVDGNSIFMVLSDLSIICFDKFSEEVKWKWKNSSPFSCSLMADQNNLFVGLEKGEIIVIDKNTGKEKFDIDIYAKDMFVYNERLFVTDEKNKIVCYDGEDELWKVNPGIKNFKISTPVMDVVFNEDEAKLFNLENGNLRRLEAMGDIIGVFSLLNEIGVLAKYKGKNELRFYSKSDLKEKKKISFKDNYKLSDAGFEDVYLVGEKDILAIDIEKKRVKWKVPSNKKKVLFTYSKGNNVFIFYKNNEIELREKKSGAKKRTFFLDRPSEDVLFTLYYKK